MHIHKRARQDAVLPRWQKCKNRLLAGIVLIFCAGTYVAGINQCQATYEEIGKMDDDCGTSQPANAIM
jgi:hypothetical protein